MNKNICYDNEKEQGDGVYLNRETLTIPDINLSTKPLDIVNTVTKSKTGLQLPNRSHKEIMKNIDNLVELQELLFDQCLPVKKCYSESTQTEDSNNILSLLTSKSPPPPMNFISVLKCKHNLQQSEKNDLEFYKPAANLSINESSIANDLYSNKISNINNVQSTEFNNAVVNICDEDLNLSSIKQNNCLSSYELSLIDEPIKLNSNNLFNKFIEKNNCEKNIDKINNDKLFTELNIITNEDIKQVLNKLNYDFDFLKKNRLCNSNNLHNNCLSLKFDENISNNLSSTCVSNEIIS